jgi:hypothetical protein
MNVVTELRAELYERERDVEKLREYCGRLEKQLLEKEMIIDWRRKREEIGKNGLVQL